MLRNGRKIFSGILLASIFVIGSPIVYRESACNACFAQDSSAADSATKDGAFSVPGWFSKDQSDIVRYPVQFSTPSPAPSQPQGMVVLNRGIGGAPTTKSFYYSVPAGPNAQAIIGVPGRSGGYGSPFSPGMGMSPYGGMSMGGLGYGGIPGLGAIPGLGGGGIVRGFGGMPFGGFGGTGFSGGYMYGAPGMTMSGSGFGFGSPFGGGFSRMSTQILIDNSASKPQGNYYAPASNYNSASGGYYSSGTPAPVPTVPINPTPYRGSDNYWGGSGNPFPKDLNKTPW